MIEPSAPPPPEPGDAGAAFEAWWSKQPEALKSNIMSDVDWKRFKAAFLAGYASRASEQP